MRLLTALAAAALIGSAALAQDRAGPAFVTLGTSGGPVSSAERSQPANALLTHDGVWLIDTGDATAQQLAKIGIPLFGVKRVFLSHLHIDHTGGLSAVISLRYQLNVPGKLVVYGPPGTKALVAGIVASLAPFAEAGYGFGDAAKGPPPVDTVEVRELAPGDDLSIGDAHVRVAQNTHFSFAPGSVDDRRSKSYSYRFDLPGKSIVYTGDTGPSAAVDALGRGADLLVAELIDLDSTIAAVRKARPDMPAAEFEATRRHLTQHHLTPEEVGAMAAAMGVRKVVATHLAIGDAGAEHFPAYVAAISARFGGEVVVAHDLDRF